MKTKFKCQSEEKDTIELCYNYLISTNSRSQIVIKLKKKDKIKLAYALLNSEIE